jgi:hypothetical protein
MIAIALQHLNIIVTHHVVSTRVWSTSTAQSHSLSCVSASFHFLSLRSLFCYKSLCLELLVFCLFPCQPWPVRVVLVVYVSAATDCFLLLSLCAFCTFCTLVHPASLVFSFVCLPSFLIPIFAYHCLWLTLSRWAVITHSQFTCHTGRGHIYCETRLPNQASFALVVTQLPPISAIQSQEDSKRESWYSLVIALHCL